MCSDLCPVSPVKKWDVRTQCTKLLQSRIKTLYALISRYLPAFLSPPCLPIFPFLLPFSWHYLTDCFFGIWKSNSSHPNPCPNVYSFLNILSRVYWTTMVGVGLLSRPWATLNSVQIVVPLCMCRRLYLDSMCVLYTRTTCTKKQRKVGEFIYLYTCLDKS